MIRRPWAWATTVKRVRRGAAEAKAAAHVALHRWLGDRWTPRGHAGVVRAKRHLAFLEALRHLEIHEGVDEAIVSSSTHADEYGVVDRRFRPDDVIVDVGAHVGTFAHLCHRRGSRSILAFEPDPTSFALLERNLGARAGVRVERRAVCRSDRSGGVSLRASPAPPDNPGAVSVLCGGRHLEIETQEVRGDPSAGAPVDVVALDDVLRACGRVVLLKLDCEGSEFPILLTSRELGRVDEIVGEVHEILPATMAALVPDARIDGVESYRSAVLRDALTAAGFRVTMTPQGAHLALFRAVSRALPPAGGHEARG